MNPTPGCPRSLSWSLVAVALVGCGASPSSSPQRGAPPAPIAAPAPPAPIAAPALPAPIAAPAPAPIAAPAPSAAVAIDDAAVAAAVRRWLDAVARHDAAAAAAVEASPFRFTWTGNDDGTCALEPTVATDPAAVAQVHHCITAVLDTSLPKLRAAVDATRVAATAGELDMTGLVPGARYLTVSHRDRSRDQYQLVAIVDRVGADLRVVGAHVENYLHDQ